ncbi:MAG: ferrous iron transport protein A [Deltaproteobacteria bacterium]|nr:ferrous iron transport protein A [Deltaproteobacteria bacterium]
MIIKTPMSAAEALTLEALEEGEEGIVTAISAPKPLRVRLLELGLLPGTRVRLLRRAPLGDPIEIEVRRTRLSLRKSDAARVFISIPKSQGASP